MLYDNNPTKYYCHYNVYIKSFKEAKYKYSRLHSYWAARESLEPFSKAHVTIYHFSTPLAPLIIQEFSQLIPCHQNGFSNCWVFSNLHRHSAAHVRLSLGSRIRNSRPSASHPPLQQKNHGKHKACIQLLLLQRFSHHFHLSLISLVLSRIPSALYCCHLLKFHSSFQIIQSQWSFPSPAGSDLSSFCILRALS